MFEYFETELRNSSPMEINIAIENLLTRYNNMDEVEGTVSRFIRSTASSLEKYPLPKYSDNTIFYILNNENKIIKSLLDNLKKKYLELLPHLKNNEHDSKERLKVEISGLEVIKQHYMKLQYGLFSALESNNSPAKCIKLMWHLQDSIWPKLNRCISMLNDNELDYAAFNIVYGQLYYLVSTLHYREEHILYPVAYTFLPENIQKELLSDAELHGILS